MQLTRRPSQLPIYMYGRETTFLKLRSALDVAKRGTSQGFKLFPVTEEYRGYEIQVEPDGGGHYMSARPLHPGLPILSRSRMKVLCSKERALALIKTAVDRLLDNQGLP